MRSEPGSATPSTGGVAAVRRPTWRLLVDGGAFYESPRWHDGRWWVTDLYRRRVLTVDPRSAEVEVFVEHDDDLGGLGWLPDGSLLVVSMTRRQVLRFEGRGPMHLHADLSDLTATPLNDLVTDANGRAWVGTYGFDLDAGEPIRSAPLFSIGPSGAPVVVAADGLVFANGAVLSADGSRLIVGETFAGRYTSWRIGRDGRLDDRRSWAQFGDLPVTTSALEVALALDIVPDGCAMDAEGCLWVADAKGARCVRVAPGGRVLTQLAMPSGSCFACALGGPTGRTLAVCAAPGSTRADRLMARDAVVLTTQVDVPAAPPLTT